MQQIHSHGLVSPDLVVVASCFLHSAVCSTMHLTHDEAVCVTFPLHSSLPKQNSSLAIRILSVYNEAE